MPATNPHDFLGYLAALLVLAAFSARDMLALRLLAIASNLAFIAYALMAGIGPVLMLHVLLLPVNIYRLAEAIQSYRIPAGAGWSFCRRP